MGLRAEDLKSDLIDKVEQRVHQRLEADRAALAERFVQQFYANVPPDDMLHDTPDNLYGAALSLLGFAQKRDGKETKVRVYSPRLDEQGWRSAHTIVEIVNDDMPFLVDSVSAELNRLDAKVHLVIHPILTVERDAKGRLTNLHGPDGAPTGALRESIMHVQVNEQPSQRHEAIREGLLDVLADVRAAVEDWRPMREHCREVIAELEESPPPLPQEEVDAGISFLKWLDDEHFTYLGYREYAFEGKGEKAVTRVPAEGGLGVLRDPSVPVFEGLRNLGKLPAEVRDFLKQPELLRITKANRRASVHRPVHMDTIAVKSFDNKGRVTGERLLLGLFTSGAYSRSPREIPLLCEKVERTVKRAGFAASSHDAKALSHILDIYPRDELFQISEDDLFATALGILNLQERQRVALFVRRDPFERFISALVFVPRDRFDTNLRLRIQGAIAETPAPGSTISRRP
jgi:glutamate dehydrogenase